MKTIHTNSLRRSKRKIAKIISSCEIVVKKAEDVQNCWIGSCSKFNVMSLGNSPKHAKEMTVEALEIVLEDRLRHPDG